MCKSSKSKEEPQMQLEDQLHLRIRVFRQGFSDAIPFALSFLIWGLCFHPVANPYAEVMTIQPFV